MSHFENGMKFTQQHHSDLNKHRQKRWFILYKNNCNWSYRMNCTAFWPKGKNILDILKVPKKIQKGLNTYIDIIYMYFWEAKESNEIVILVIRDQLLPQRSYKSHLRSFSVNILV